MSDAVTNNWSLSMAGISLHSTQQNMQVVSRTEGGGCIEPLKYTATACHSPICRYSKMYCTSHGESTKAYLLRLWGCCYHRGGYGQVPCHVLVHLLRRFQPYVGQTVRHCIHTNMRNSTCAHPSRVIPLALVAPATDYNSLGNVHPLLMAMHFAWSLSPVD